MQVRDSIGKLIRELPDLAKNVDLAQKIQQKYPDSKPGRVIEKVLSGVDLSKIRNYEQTIKELEDWQNSRA